MPPNPECEPESAAPPVPWRQLALYLLLPALVLRLLSLALCASDPLVRYPFEDGLSYAKWALSIAEGDWLGLSRPVFYQAPLYPYMLAVMQVLGVGFFPWPQLLNCLAGTATVGLVFLTTVRIFGARTAWWAGGIAALWGPALMYEVVLDKVALGLAVTAFGLWLLVELDHRLRSQHDHRHLIRRAVLSGVALGVGALLRENLLVVAPAAALWLFLRYRTKRIPLMLLAGVALGVLPSLTHNLLVGGAFLPTTYQAGTNFWIGNHAGAQGTYEPLVVGHGDPLHEERDARTLAATDLGMREEDVHPTQVNRYWWGQGLSYVFDSFGSWLGLTVRKMQWFVYHAEAPDSMAYDAFRDGRPWLLPSRLLAGLLLPLAVVGAWLAWRQQSARFVAGLGLVAAASVVLFFVVSRYRLACLPFLLPLAAHAVTRIQGRYVLAGACLPMLLVSWIWWPSTPPAGLAPGQQQALLWLNRGTALAMWTQDEARTIHALEKALELESDFLAAHQVLARYLMAPDRAEFGRALPHCRAAVRLAPDDWQARHNLGYCLFKNNQHAAAESELRQVVELRDGQPPFRSVRLLILCLEAQGRRQEGIDYLRRQLSGVEAERYRRLLRDHFGDG